jgi:hypothetical protein
MRDFLLAILGSDVDALVAAGTLPEIRRPAKVLGKLWDFHTPDEVVNVARMLGNTFVARLSEELLIR